MIGLDTNVLVRYLTQDDPTQSPRATELIERRLTEGNPGFLSIVAMASRLGARALMGFPTSELPGHGKPASNSGPRRRVRSRGLRRDDCPSRGNGSFADALIGNLVIGLAVPSPSPSTGRRVRNFVLLSQCLGHRSGELYRLRENANHSPPPIRKPPLTRAIKRTRLAERARPARPEASA